MAVREAGRGATAGRGARTGRWLEYSCSTVPVSNVGDFSTTARNDNVYVWFYHLLSMIFYRKHTIPQGWRADEGVRPYSALSNVNTGIADLPTAARRRADEERPYHALTNFILASF